ncbi:MAG: metal ABC transporter ATP-binding protein [Eubacteriales bacterium]
MKLIEANNLAIGYGNKKIAEDINVTIQEGQYICIVGENGTGKSTFVKTLLGLLKPIAGEIRFENGLIQKDVGYIPQDMFVKGDFPATVLEIVCSGLLSMPGCEFFYNKEAKNIAEKNMEKLGISNLKNSSFRELSGGQRQRTLIARALCSATKILFLDEPVAGLDTETQDELYKILGNLNKEGMTIVMISHDIDNAVLNATHMMNMKKTGTILQDTQSFLMAKKC